MLTQAQSIENLLTGGMPQHGGQALLEQDGLGAGTAGGTVACSSPTMSYQTRRLTLTTSLNFAIGTANFTIGTNNLDGSPITLPFNDAVTFGWGPFTFIVYADPGSASQPGATGTIYDFQGTFGTNHYVGVIQILGPAGPDGLYVTQYFFPPIGGSGSISITWDFLEIKTLGSVISYTLENDPDGSYSIATSYNGQNYNTSGLISSLGASVLAGISTRWNIVYQALGDTGFFSISNAQCNSNPIDFTCNANGSYTVTMYQLDQEGTPYEVTVTESASGGLGEFVYNSSGRAYLYYQPDVHPGQIILVVGMPTTARFSASCLNAFGAASMHEPTVQVGWLPGGFSGIDYVFTFLQDQDPVPWGMWGSGPFQYKSIGPIGVGVDYTYDWTTDTYLDSLGMPVPTITHYDQRTGVPLGQVNPFERGLFKAQQDYPAVFSAQLHPTWKAAHNWGGSPLDLVFYDDNPGFEATTLSLASSLTVDAFSSVSNWHSSTGTIAGSAPLQFTATHANASVINNNYDVYGRHYRFIHVTLSGSAASPTLVLHSSYGFRTYCLPTLTGTPTTIEIMLTEPHDPNHYFVDSTQVGPSSGLVWGPDRIYGITFAGLNSGETLTCSSIVLIRKDGGTMDGGVWATPGQSPHIYIFSDKKIGDFRTTDYPGACLNAWVQAINDMTAQTGLSASAPSSGTPSTVYNGEQSPLYIDYIPVDTDLSSTALNWRYRASGMSFWEGYQNADITFSVLVEHFVHGLSSILQTATGGNANVRVTGGEQADEYLTPDSTDFYYRSGSRFPPAVERMIQGPNSVTATGTGPSLTVDGRAGFNEPGWIWAGFAEEFTCPHINTSSNSGGEVCLLRNYTARRHVYEVDGSGNMSVALYDDNDSHPTSVIIEAPVSGGTCGYPSFYRQGDVLIDGTYLNGVNPRLARSRTHGRSWSVMHIPGTYDASTSAPNHGRIIFLGFKKADPSATPPTSADWFCRVGVPQDDGTYSWSDEVALNLTNPTGAGDLKERFDGVMEFCWQDGGGNTNFLYGRLIDNNGGDPSDWTAS